MKKELLEQAAEYQKKHKRVKRWQRLVTLLEAIVVFVTTYALILPAITRESQPTCGFDEHQHNDDCYQTVAQRIVCDVEVHTHLDECYDQTGACVCGYYDSIVHSHNDFCYDAFAV